MAVIHSFYTQIYCRTHYHSGLQRGGASSKDDGVEHGSEALPDVGRHQHADLLLQVTLRVLFTDVLDGKLFFAHLILFFHGLQWKSEDRGGGARVR